jgi:hypothetical protein
MILTSSSKYRERVACSLFSFAFHTSFAWHSRLYAYSNELTQRGSKVHPSICRFGGYGYNKNLVR